MALVTIIVATHNRPALLRWTVRSILDQSFKDWCLLVVGDRCAPETGDLMAGFDDPRIFYVNTQERCGEQSGPNSAGMMAAKTKYVAFANHDDLWLPDHLERAVAALEGGKIDFYAAAAALTAIGHDVDTNSYRYGIGAVTPPNRTVAEGMNRGPVYFEPVSSWVMKTGLRDKVGVWNPAGTLYRTPLEDWILRAWRAGARLHFADTVSVIYCNGAKARKLGDKEADVPQHNYDVGDDENNHWYRLIGEKGADGIRRQANSDTLGGTRGQSKFDHTFAETPLYHVFEALQTDKTAELYRKLGWDGFSTGCRLIKAPKGFRLRKMLKRRTGEELETKENWRSVSEHVKAALAENTRWQKV